MKAKLHDLKDNEILEQLENAKKELREHRFQYAIARSLENPKVISNLKKKVARLLTIQREREIANTEKSYIFLK